MTKQSVIWGIFVLLFFASSIFELYRSQKPLKSLRGAMFRNPQSGITGTAKIMGVDFQELLGEIERENKVSHRIAATAYALAGLTSVASFVLSK